MNKLSKKKLKETQPKKKNLLFSIGAYLLIPILAFIIYGHTLNYPLDKLDEDLIITNHIDFIKNKANLTASLKLDAFFNQPVSYQFYRPMQNLSFMIDGILFNGSVVGFHLTNLILHILTCLLLFYLLNLLGFNHIISFLSSLLFCCHPLFTQAVIWIPARGDLLIALFFILVFIYFYKYLLNQKLIYLILCLFFILLSVFSKETALIIPLVLFVYLYIFNKNNLLKPKALIPVVFSFIICLFYIICRNAISGFTSGSFGFAIFFSNIFTIPELMCKFLIPFNLSPMPFFSIAVSAIGIILIFILGYSLFKFKYHNINLIVFGILWFSLFSIPGMFYKHDLAPFAYDYLEHRAYLPFIGLIFIFGGILNTLIKKYKFLPYFVTVYIFVFLIITINRTNIYKDFLSFYNSSIESHPNFIAYFNLGATYQHNKSYNDAILNLNKAITINPIHSDVFNARGTCFLLQQKYNEALEDFNKALSIKNNSADVLMNKAITEQNLNMFDASMADFNTSINLNPKIPQAYNGRGVLKGRQNKLNESLEDLSKAIELNPKYIEAYINRGNCFYYLKNNDEACKNWQIAYNLGGIQATDIINKYCK